MELADAGWFQKMKLVKSLVCHQPVAGSKRRLANTGWRQKDTGWYVNRPRHVREDMEHTIMGPSISTHITFDILMRI